jgi:hypothetical protein
MLYRRTYAGAPLEPGNRRFLTFDGIFYDGDIWLDGGYVGATAGYFFGNLPFVREHLDKIIWALIFVPGLIAIYGGWRASRAEKARAQTVG